MTFRRWVGVCAFILAMPCFSVSASAQDSDACPAGPVGPLALPATKAAIADGRQAIIVALGSSSSRGAAASDPAHSYPAILQARLTALLPNASLSVVNRGNDGEDAPRELARLATDVIAVRPQLVIWQVGANGALRDSDPAVFRTLVATGVATLAKADIDVILMDNQRSPKIVNAPHHTDIENALADVAHDSKTNLFSRGALMDGWRDQGFAYADFIASDGLHHNDRGYRCIAEALAHAIADAVKRHPATYAVGR